MVIAGVFGSHMPVSQTRAKSALSSCLFCFEKRNEVFRSDFLFALDDDGDVDRQRTRDLLPGTAGLDEGHQLALVVLGAARDDDLSPVGVIGDDGFEGRAVPEIERIDRLHIVVTVEQHVRSPSLLPLVLATMAG